MQDIVEDKLDQLRSDYVQVVGEPFRYFFCPILFKDEENELCKAHILNQAFPNTSRKWTVQRSDVDSFFGSKFESSFTTLQYREAPMETFWRTGSPNKSLKPELHFQGQKVDYYLPKDVIPSGHSNVLLQGRSSLIRLAVKMHPERMDQAQGHDWSFVLESDCRVTALVSVLKAAHLAMFEMLGYRYALSLGGIFLGHTILGRFLEQNFKLSKSEVLQNAKAFFAQYANLVRPVLRPENVLDDTIDGRNFYICEEPSLWAFLILLRTDHLIHSAIIPVLESAQAVSRFVEFLDAKESTLKVRKCQLVGDAFQASSTVEEFLWPEAKFSSY